MARKSVTREPITNAVVAATAAKETLQAAFLAVSGVQQCLKMLDENKDLEAAQIRSMLAICRKPVDDAMAAFDWSEQ